jgi:hypothetical protein
MSEKISSAESLFKGKHKEWLKKEGGAGILGATGGLLSAWFLKSLGIINPVFLTVGAALGAVGGYLFYKKTTDK